MKLARMLQMALAIVAVALTVLLTMGCEKEKGVVVTLGPGANIQPYVLPLKISNGKDHVRWFNTTDTTRVVVFTARWPFTEAKTDTIVVGPKAMSAWYTLAPEATSANGLHSKYKTYAIPLPPGGETPPDGPDISGQP